MKEQIVAYLSGKITGVKNQNREAFAQAKKQLEKQGFAVLSPAENFGGVSVPSLRHLYMRRDVLLVLEADVVVVLPDWKNSKGALCEVNLAREIGIPVLHLEDLSEVTETVLLTAQDVDAIEKYFAVDNSSGPIVAKFSKNT